ncbi:ComF family protein [Paenibacillus sp. GSMTC-2017]|uniref:ComF family protein n=1 Tax=Paenibacillus sp. GSMTC-2017 TaxID=2794350 RepID=UPI0018D83094|nr:ComF family protein [Paenibacillus sp. GSMTC-2017]MBH5320614.1 ComF family protein [Paenibacillus sp. GSMTC-2017]
MMRIISKLMVFITHVGSLASRSVDFMVPQSSNCTICGKGMASNKTRREQETREMAILHRSLCGECYSSIPWLSRIICSYCGRSVQCDDCLRRKERPFLLNRSAVTYSSSMREWLALYKYRGNERLGPILTAMLVPVLLRLTKEVLTQSKHVTKDRESFSKTRKKGWMEQIKSSLVSSKENICWDAITYVPISNERAQERGFNQAEQLAESLATTFRIPLYQLLLRERHTEKMSFKTRSERLRDAQQLFSLNRGQLEELVRRADLQGTLNRRLRILLIDDIYTTGSTVEACANVIKEHEGEKFDIYVLTWARS